MQTKTTLIPTSLPETLVASSGHGGRPELSVTLSGAAEAGNQTTGPTTNYCTFLLLRYVSMAWHRYGGYRGKEEARSSEMDSDARPSCRAAGRPMRPRPGPDSTPFENL